MSLKFILEKTLNKFKDLTSLYSTLVESCSWCAVVSYVKSASPHRQTNSIREESAADQGVKDSDPSHNQNDLVANS